MSGSAKDRELLPMWHRAAWPNVEADRGRTAELIKRQEKSMKRYVIEREIPGASELSEAQLAEIAAKSNDVVGFVDAVDLVPCDVARDPPVRHAQRRDDVEEAIREHARRGGF